MHTYMGVSVNPLSGSYEGLHAGRTPAAMIQGVRRSTQDARRAEVLLLRSRAHPLRLRLLPTLTVDSLLRTATPCGLKFFTTPRAPTFKVCGDNVRLGLLLAARKVPTAEAFHAFAQEVSGWPVESSLEGGVWK